MKNQVNFVEGLSLAELFPSDEKSDGKGKDWYNWYTEIVNHDEGWVYERLNYEGKKGKKLRKYYEKIYRNTDKSITFWKPKINDLATCESKRWMAIQYLNNQIDKIAKVFPLVLDNTPFCYLKLNKEHLKYDWIIFPHYGNSSGVSWDWWEYSKYNNGQERPDFPLKQNIGDAWFDYESRSKEVRKRSSYFEQVFNMSLKEHYENAFYKSEIRRKSLLVINGRNYLIGDTNSGFGVIAYPEELDVEIIGTTK